MTTMIYLTTKKEMRATIQAKPCLPLMTTLTTMIIIQPMDFRPPTIATSFSNSYPHNSHAYLSKSPTRIGHVNATSCPCTYIYHTYFYILMAQATNPNFSNKRRLHQLLSGEAVLIAHIQFSLHISNFHCTQLCNKTCK